MHIYALYLKCITPYDLHNTLGHMFVIVPMCLKFNAPTKKLHFKLKYKTFPNEHIVF